MESGLVPRARVVHEVEREHSEDGARVVCAVVSWRFRGCPEAAAGAAATRTRRVESSRDEAASATATSHDDDDDDGGRDEAVAAAATSHDDDGERDEAVAAAATAAAAGRTTAKAKTRANQHMCPWGTELTPMCFSPCS